MSLQGCASAMGKMTRTTAAPAPFQARPTKQGHKRKGKPVEAWMLELQRAQDEENGTQESLDLTAIEQIADGVEQMVFSWGVDKQERGQEYAKLSKSLARGNSHELPWSLNKTEELALESASEREAAVTRGDGAAVTPVIAIRPLKQRGHRRDRFVLADSENPQPLKGENGAPQGKHESAKCLLSDPCHGVLTASNRMRVCPAQSKGGFKTRAREDSTCQAVIAEQESMGGSTEVGSVAQKGHILVLPKEGELWPCVGTVWTLEVPIPSPERRTHQEDVVNETGDGLAPIFAGEVGGSVAPLLGRSPLCARSPSPSGVREQGSEVSNERDGLLTSLADPHEDRAEGFISLLPFLDASPCCGEETESVEVGGHTIKVSALRGGMDVLEDKFQSLVRINAGALGVQEERDHLKPSTTADVEELQIALLECAMEYEIKTIEAKMKMQELKLKGQQAMVVAKSEHPCSQRAVEPVSTCERAVDNQRLQLLRKKMAKLQHEKGNLSNELHALKKKERQFERQKRSLDEALLRVNRLQRWD